MRGGHMKVGCYEGWTMKVVRYEGWTYEGGPL